MKVTLFSIGTRGDIEPFLTIAQLLKERDCDVLCVFPEQYRVVVESMDLPFKGFSKDILNLINGKEMKMVFGNQGSILKRIILLIKMARASLKLSKDTLVLQHRIQMEEKPDWILYHPKCNYSVLWGIRNPGKTILVNPTLDPLTDLGKNCGKSLKKINRWFVNTMKAVMLKRISKLYKEDFYGTEITVSSIRRSILEKEKTFYTISPSLFPKPDYWPHNVTITGFYERDTDMNWQPEEDLQLFIEKYKKIIFITFGSMSNPSPKEKTQSIVKILKRNNIPAIVNISWGGLEKIDESPDNIFFTRDLPYSWIFPKVYGVVHHGGSGTTHTALKYACPSLIIPHVLDQYYWEKTISKLKLGPKGISIRKFNEKEFEIRLLDLYDNNDYKKNSISICKKMKSESNKNKLYEMIVS